MFCWYFFRSCTFNHQKTLFLQWIFMFLHIRKCDNVHYCSLWDWFGMGFWIALGSILAALRHHIPCFGVIVLLMIFRIGTLIDFDHKWISTLRGLAPLFHHFFDRVPWRMLRRFLASLWIPFGSMLVVFDSLFDPFWNFLQSKPPRSSPESVKHLLYIHSCCYSFLSSRSSRITYKRLTKLRSYSHMFYRWLTPTTHYLQMTLQMPSRTSKWLTNDSCV